MKTSIARKHFGWRPASFWIGLFQIGFTTTTPLPLCAQPWQTPTSQLDAVGSIACSQDGQRLYVTSGDGLDYLFVSTNLGGSWTEPLLHISSPASCSGDGTKVAVPSGASVLISTNGGVAFTTNYAGGGVTWLVWSQSGNMLAALDDEGVWFTTNLGATWTKPPAMQTNDWQYLAVSGDGRVLAAADPGTTGHLRVSTNYGVSWTDAPVTNHEWNAVACTADGAGIIASSLAFPPPLVASKDGGKTWSYPFVTADLQGSNGGEIYFQSLACSQDGSLVVGKVGTKVFLSRDFGVSWVNDPSSNLGINEVTCSKDGTLLAGAGSSDYTFVFQYLAPPLRLVASGDLLTLSWPAPSSQYVLQQTSDLASTNWLPITNALTVTNYRNQVVLPAPASGNVFYRLYGPGS